MTCHLRCGMIGDHIGQSRFSRALELVCNRHELKLEFTSIDTAERAGFDFERQLESIVCEEWTGVTVTHPHKMSARAWADDTMETSVAHLASANILTFGEARRGYNTDYTGFLSAWRARFGNQAPGLVAVAGAGGVASAVVPALEYLGASRTYIWDPKVGRAEALSERCGPSVVAIDPEQSDEVVRGATGIVNATALGMGSSMDSAFATSSLGSQEWAFDAVYTPVSTPFLVSARASGLLTISGFELFRHMLLNSFEAYTGIVPDIEAVMPLIDELKPE